MKQNTNIFSNLSAPAQHALKAEGINTFKQLSKYSRKYILGLHGIGPTTIPKLENLLQKKNLDFKN